MNILDRIGLPAASWYLRNTPGAIGRWRIVRHFLPVLRKEGAELGERVISTQYGFKYKADLGDWLGQYVYLTGTYEPPTARIIAGILSPGDTFIDIGANSGFFTLLASSRVGPLGKVLAFEPVPSMRARLIENTVLNSMQNVTVHSIAVSNTEGILSLFEGPEGHKGISSLRPINNAASTFEIRTVPLDSFSDSITSVKLIKIDVEGAEQLVVEGMQSILAKYRPFLILEITDEYLRSFGHNAIMLAKRLTESGYRMYAIRDEGLTQISPAQAADDPQFNAFFTFGSVPENLMARS